MPGTKTSILKSLLLLSAASICSAATPDLFPLQTGNSWVFRSQGTRWFSIDPQTIDITGTDQLRGREYFRVKLFGETLHLRESEGVIYALNPTSGEENPWLVLNGTAGQDARIQFDSCTNGMRIDSTEAKIATPAREWTNAVRIIFSQSCADAGMTALYLVPGVGPVAYEKSSLAGPIQFELTYSRTGPVAAEAPQTAFTVALDAPRYHAAEVLYLKARLTVRSAQPITLTFPSGQRFDLRIWNDRGEIVYTWSADKLFPQVITQEEVGPGERSFAFTAEVPNLPPGRYVAEAWLATQSREFVGTVGFVVQRQIDSLP